MTHLSRSFFIAAGLYLLIVGISQAEIPSTSTMSLSQVLALAREKNPDIIAARQRARGIEAQVSSAKGWSDPVFSYRDENIPSGMEGVPPEKIKHYSVEQPFLFPGKRLREGQMKHHEALIAEANAQFKVIEVLNKVRMYYYQLFLTDEKIALASQSVDIMRSALKSAQARLGSNQSTTADVFMAQTELRRMENELFEQQQQRTLVQIELNSLLNQPTDTPWEKAQSLELVDIPLSLTELREITRRNAPLFQAAQHEVNHSQTMLSRSRIAFAPDFSLMYDRQEPESGPAGREIGVSVGFPLWIRRPWGEYRSAKEHLLEAEATSQSMQNMVLKMVHKEFVETNTHLTLTRNYLSGTLPVALSNLKIAREQYASGQGDLLRLLEAFRTWVISHNEYQEELYHYGEHWSELEQWVGVELMGQEKNNEK